MPVRVPTYGTPGGSEPTTVLLKLINSVQRCTVCDCRVELARTSTC